MRNGFIIDPEPFMSGMEYAMYQKIDDLTISPKITFNSAMNRYPATWLTASLAAWQLPMKGTKRDKLDALYDRVHDASRLAQVVGQLSNDERTVLSKVLAAGGVLKYQSISRTYGDETADTYFWESTPPTSVIGRLRCRGLLFVGRMQIGSRREKMLVIASDLRDSLEVLRSVEDEAKPANKAKASAKPKAEVIPGAAEVYELDVVLADIEPAIWRRLSVPASISLAQLHQAIQCAMGWQGAHLYQFEINGESYGQSDPELLIKDARRVHLSDFGLRQKRSFAYIYDFGDDWRHQVTVRAIRPQSPEETIPTLLAGARACPPEDIGGPFGYSDCLRIQNDPHDPQYDEIREWLGETFDPEIWNLDRHQTRLRNQAKRSRWLNTPS